MHSISIEYKFEKSGLCRRQEAQLAAAMASLNGVVSAAEFQAAMSAFLGDSHHSSPELNDSWAPGEEDKGQENPQQSQPPHSEYFYASVRPLYRDT